MAGLLSSTVGSYGTQRGQPLPPLPPATTQHQKQQQQQEQSTRQEPQHVPLLPRSTDNNASRPTAPSHGRQRVRRACLECRTKKVKCDGSEICSRCASYNIACKYVEFSANPPRASHTADLGQVERLESRVASMEQMFRQFLDQFANNKSNSPVPKETQAQSIPEPTAYIGPIDSQLSERPDKDDHVLEQATQILATPHVSRIQQLLDAAEADAAGRHGVGGENDDPAGAVQIPTTEEPHIYESHDCKTGERHDGTGQCYADGFGELDVDSHGQLRYLGLGSTAGVAVENCIGLRRHITKGLEERGYGAEETVFTSAEETHSDESVDGPAKRSLELDLPPADLVDVLISIYAKDLAYLFPITTEREIQDGYRKLLSPDAWDPGHAAAFFALLAVAAPLLPADSGIFDKIDQRWLSSGPIFYNQAMHFVNMPFNANKQRKERSSDIVVALGLLSMYLAETGLQAEAWMSVGRAIRIAQDIGLHRSPERLRLPREDWSKRRYIWWCLYILERQLCTALGRPLSINDEDCDTEIPVATNKTAEQDSAGFTSMIHLHRIIGTILKIVNSVKNADFWRSEGKRDELQMRVREANDALQTWAKDMVPLHLKTAKSGKLLAEKHIALSSFFSAVMLLHRAFIRNPHRPSPLAGSQAQLRSAKAATDCIRGTKEFFQCVPKSHFMVFHGQYVFVAALILLSCIRWSDDPKFVYQALRDVEEAMEVLRGLEKSWKGAKRCRGTVEEYLEFTFSVLQGDRKCHFECDHGHLSHDVRNCKSTKRRPSEPATKQAPKRARLSHPGPERKQVTVLDPLPETPTSLSKQISNISDIGAVSPQISWQTNSDPCFFDNTIDNFLGALEPGLEYHDQLDFSLYVGSNPSGMAFMSPEDEHNSFF